MDETKKFFGLKCRWCKWSTPFRGRYDIARAYRRLADHIDRRHDKDEGEDVLWESYNYSKAEDEWDEIEERRERRNHDEGVVAYQTGASYDDLEVLDEREV